MDAVVDIFDVLKRQKMLPPVGGVIPGKFDLAGFDALDDAHVQPVVADDFHMLFDPVDLAGRNHGMAPVCCLKNVGAHARFRLVSGIRWRMVKITPRCKGQPRADSEVFDKPAIGFGVLCLVAGRVGRGSR
jgi:hypothetical protein